MTTEESTPPDTQADARARRAPARTGAGSFRCSRGSASSRSSAAVVAHGVDPRVANPNAEGRPRPVEFLTGFDHWQVVPQVGALIMVVVLTIVFIAAGGATPAVR